MHRGSHGSHVGDIDQLIEVYAIEFPGSYARNDTEDYDCGIHIDMPRKEFLTMLKSEQSRARHKTGRRFARES